ncbi:Pr6Pr family membrane protein [Agrococcus sp. ARC_14]|uniref:Pr6Pr family membrane protein n=1 Tax=Agrococcus sp. ARC_14 TaxID=2919927 RepID=UPI001F052BE6|nr:Pr6Pr family membrane protein [Agrococcus sp. ARC_14]MCH1881841.1 Pr6Pr family membrane protein [Agrococcus sp. ARC_14]
MSAPPEAAPVADIRRRILLVGRAIIAVAIFAAIIGQLLTSLAVWTERGDPSMAVNVTNFFSFFTIESNILAMIVLALLGVAQLGHPRIGRRFDVLLLCATTYMVVTGIVYNTMLRGIELPQGTTLGWSNEILHLIAPLWMLLDWLLTSSKRQVRFSDLWIVAIFPVVWLGYTLLRAPITPNYTTGADAWYPYPFLNPANFENGFGGVAIMCVIVAVTVVLGGLALIAYARWRRTRTS